MRSTGFVPRGCQRTCPEDGTPRGVPRGRAAGTPRGPAQRMGTIWWKRCETCSAHGRLLRAASWKSSRDTHPSPPRRLAAAGSRSVERAGAAPQAPPHPRTASAVSNAAAAQGVTSGCPLFGRPLKGSARRRGCQKQLMESFDQIQPPAFQLPATDNLRYFAVLGGSAAAERGQLYRRGKGRNTLRPRSSK